MLTDIVLSKVPFPYGKYASIIMRVLDPTSVTWETIFDFIEETAKMPRCFLAGSDYKGKYIYGKYPKYPPWIYDNYRLCKMDGVYTMSALVNIHFTPFGNCQLKKRH
jgi:hypothetical protein